jgi:hypothetical protein
MMSYSRNSKEQTFKLINIVEIRLKNNETVTSIPTEDISGCSSREKRTAPREWGAEMS